LGTYSPDDNSRLKSWLTLLTNGIISAERQKNHTPEGLKWLENESYKVELENINFLLILAGIISFVEILQIKYLNNLVKQDHRFIKKITKPMMGFKVFYSAKATITGIETTHMIRKGHLSD
jgi:putative transposase